MRKPDFTYVIYIAATPQKVWKALTASDVLARYWHGRRFRTDWNVGSPMQTLDPQGRVDWDGKVLQFDPPRRLSYTFQIRGFQKKSSRLVFNLEKQDALVKLTLSHFAIEPRCRAGFAAAWPAFFSTLKSLLETGKPLKFKD